MQIINQVADEEEEEAAKGQGRGPDLLTSNCYPLYNCVK